MKDIFMCIGGALFATIHLLRTLKRHKNREGEIVPEGEAVPYQWGSMVITYKRSKFQKHKMVPVEEWADLWRPEFAGRISMFDSPREVVGSVLKYMGASHNTEYCFASSWWNERCPSESGISRKTGIAEVKSDVLNRQSQLPRDLKLIRSGAIHPSLIHERIELRLQAARAIHFKQEAIPGATPSDIESSVTGVPKGLTKGKSKPGTNPIARVPPIWYID
ncbi:hypothetical protein SADUNF_Sadunf01G0103800 [Salix dunnii]|uniref:Uncharacterized protein n=1 Tax=Salix dunnii TaxID=1413687 RepID=A0A835TJX1_9ROSI|nr:hypothetical protein SADUNF_Sadunf01G0103800 [Salix dunnii]